MVGRRCAALLWVPLVVGLAGGRARAEETNAPSLGPSPATESVLDAARKGFRQGVDAARAGRFEDARVAFGESARLYPHPVTLYNLALSELELGEPESAIYHLERALARGGGPDELNQETRLAASERSRQLVSELVRVRVELASDQAELAFGDRVLRRLGAPEVSLFVPVVDVDAPPERLPRRFEVLIRPGVIQAELRRGARVATYRVEAAAGETRELREVELLPVEPVSSEERKRSVPPATAGVHRSVFSSRHQAGPPAGEPAPGRVLLWGSVGVAAAATVSTVVLGVLALSEERALRERCPEKRSCPWGTRERGKAVEQLALAADVSLAIGLVAGGVAVWAALSEPTRPGRSRAVYGVRGSF